ncbi:molybdate ABC transporter permease subunit [soil metagenome]
MDWVALALSVKLALCTCAAVLPIALGLATYLALGPRRGRGLLEAVVALPLVLPPTVIGFYLLMVFGPRYSPVGAWLDSIGLGLVFSFGGLVVGSVLYSLPFAVQPMAAALRGVPLELIDVARSAGATRWRTLTRVVWPLGMPGIVVGMVLTFAHTLGEFGIVMMIGGARPGITKTASIAVYEDVQTGEFARAGWTSAVLIAIALACIVPLGMLRERWWRR